MADYVFRLFHLMFDYVYFERFSFHFSWRSFLFSLSVSRFVMIYGFMYAGTLNFISEMLMKCNFFCVVHTSFDILNTCFMIFDY